MIRVLVLSECSIEILNNRSPRDYRQTAKLGGSSSQEYRVTKFISCDKQSSIPEQDNPPENEKGPSEERKFGSRQTERTSCWCRVYRIKAAKVGGKKLNLTKINYNSSFSRHVIRVFWIQVLFSRLATRVAAAAAATTTTKVWRLLRTLKRSGLRSKVVATQSFWLGVQYYYYYYYYYILRLCVREIKWMNARPKLKNSVLSRPY